MNDGCLGGWMMVGWTGELTEGGQLGGWVEGWVGGGWLDGWWVVGGWMDGCRSAHKGVGRNLGHKEGLHNRFIEDGSLRAVAQWRVPPSQALRGQCRGARGTEWPLTGQQSLLCRPLRVDASGGLLGVPWAEPVLSGWTWSLG